MPTSKTQNKTKKTSVKTAQKSSDIPEFIEGIPTQRRFKEERRNLVKQYYRDLWRNLQRKRKSLKGWNYIHNDYLGVNVYIEKNESDKKTEGISKNHWKSTYAVKHLYDVVKYAKPLGKEIETDKTGSKTQGKNGYKKLIILYHQFTSPKHYLNFTVKLTIGIKAEEQHIQYSVCKVNVK